MSFSILTDDQGYGDLACHGNPIIKTPNIDRLHNESVRRPISTSAHFARRACAALMTGHYPARTGAYLRTSSGRTMLHTDERTIADVFAEMATPPDDPEVASAYWPHRPQDHGFQDVVWHRCGGVGQASDHIGVTTISTTPTSGTEVREVRGLLHGCLVWRGHAFHREEQGEAVLLPCNQLALHGPSRPSQVEQAVQGEGRLGIRGRSSTG